MLWLWALGLCDQFIRNHLSSSIYDQKANQIYNEVKRLNRNSHNNSHLKIGPGQPGDSVLHLKTSREEIGSLTVKTSYNLYLLQNWNLFDCLQYSEAVIPKLNVWQRGSFDKLKKLVAKMGVPLVQSKQKFEHLQETYRTKLMDRISELIDSEILGTNVFTTDFCFQFDHRHQFSSLNFSRMANSLLSCPTDFSGLIFYFFFIFYKNNSIKFILYFFGKTKS